MTGTDRYTSAKRLSLRGARRRVAPSATRVRSGVLPRTITAVILWALVPTTPALAQFEEDPGDGPGGVSRCGGRPPTRTNRCDDGNICTRDMCHCEGDSCGCVYDDQDGLSCESDGDPCTRDVCNGTSCTHAPMDDGEICFCYDIGVCIACCGGVCCSGHCCSGECCQDNDRCCDNECCTPGLCCEGETTCCQTCCYSDQCCPQPCCEGNTTCCESDEVCCQDVCGREGACCFFDTGTCSETTQYCCTADGGTYQGDGSTCDPPDLCRPICENCHAVNLTFDECRHTTSNPAEPCSLWQCTQNIMDTASCDFFPDRVGPRNCDTFDTGIEGEVGQFGYDLPIPMVCETSNPGGFHVWAILFGGCGTACAAHGYTVRCDTNSCPGPDPPVRFTPRGTERICGCP